jgi:hypothetical protein
MIDETAVAKAIAPKLADFLIRNNLAHPHADAALLTRTFEIFLSQELPDICPGCGGPVWDANNQGEDGIPCQCQNDE